MLKILKKTCYTPFPRLSNWLNRTGPKFVIKLQIECPTEISMRPMSQCWQGVKK